ncbi:hypothetical protein [Streptomyces lavendulae]|uniref:hypothetical protein n=1 Tax=Streptomyces lavendulae TaxID=1914 RepID=UPI0024A3AECB|nr:hypothetical protein [Streptomyces lavendulae]GLW04525.1 hypothetical protein Slala05_81550 [Streptomyces lavendulae subsp. lavendulae]
MDKHAGLPSADFALPGSTWTDLLGPRRRREATERMARRCWLGEEDDKPWVSRRVDRDALEMAYTLLALISPTGPPDRDRDAIIVFGAMSAVLDSAGTKMSGFTHGDLLERNFRGSPVKEWARRAARGVDQWTADLMVAGLYQQIRQLSENRVERTLEESAERHRINRDNYREYLRWRDHEGWYFGGLLCCAIAAGIDVRNIPTHWIDETLEASILAFDIHGSLRHACEDELGHSLNYLHGNQHQQVTTALGAYTEILLRIQDTDELQAREKEYLIRFVTGIITAAYGTSRYNRTTAVHVARPEDVTVLWSQIDDDPLYRYTYTEATSAAASKD